MALPTVNGWLIDFRTARVVFAARGNQLVDALIAMCENGTLQYCHCEHADFKSDAALIGPFIQDQDCRCSPDVNVMQTSGAIVGGNYNKPLLKSDMITVFLISTALVHQFGIISSLTNPVFSMAVDIGPGMGVPVLTPQEFQAAL